MSLAKNPRPVRLSREELYELAWSKPMSQLAKDFGISNVALARRCRRLKVPVPGPGYWAKLSSGQAPPRPLLSPRQPDAHDEDALTMAPSRFAPDYYLASLREGSVKSDHDAEDAAWLAARVSCEARHENRIEVRSPARAWDPVIREYRQELVSAARAMRRSQRNRRQDLIARKPRAFRVSLESYRRALAIGNALAVAARARGFALRSDAEAGRIVFGGYQAEVQLRITEVLEKGPRQPSDRTDESTHPGTECRLRVSLALAHSDGPSFEDKDERRLESMLNRVFVAIYKLTVRDRALSRKDSDRQERWRQEIRRAMQRQTVREEGSREVSEERRRRQELSREARNWEEARRIREYVAAKRLGCDTQAANERWAKWALRVADEIDPLRTRG